MDATQKRRMWKVAIIHFPLSDYFLINFLTQDKLSHGFSNAATTWSVALASLSKTILALLQPHFYLMDKFFGTILMSVPKSLLMLLCLISVPVWSICFSWLFVKLDNWLNHFPVLGKRVF